MDPNCRHADSEDSDQTGRMPRLICLRWAHMILQVLSCVGSIMFISSVCLRFLMHMDSSLKLGIFHS